jgi:predicted TIM-barrel fold metal-dependent hydrolase
VITPEVARVTNTLLRIVDAHNHPDWHSHDFERFTQNMAQNGISRSWLLTWECPPDEYDPQYNDVLAPEGAELGPISFAKALRYKERAPGKFVLGYMPDPRRPDAIDRLRAAVDIHGAQVCGELKLRMMYDNPDAIRLYRYAGSRGMPVTVHIDYEFDTGRKYPRPNWWYGGGIEAFERAVRACPDTVFIGHAPGWWAHLSGDDQFDKVPYPSGPVLPGGKLVQMLRQYPNLCCDISAGSGHTALSRDLAFTKDFLIEFQDRVLYGRDYFDNRHQELLNSLGLPTDVLAKIYAGNAERLVGT